MIQNAENRFAWKMPLVGALAALVAVLPSIIFGNDLGADLATIGLFIGLGLILLIAAALKVRYQPISALAMLASFCVVAWLLFKVSYDIYETGRWFAFRSEFKADVLRQGSPDTRELKHIEWDGWGFAGSDTEVYLVFDPHDRLASKKYEGKNGPPPGIDCNVSRIHRLERHWYSVTFFTNTGWDQCE